MKLKNLSPKSLLIYRDTVPDFYIRWSTIVISVSNLALSFLGCTLGASSRSILADLINLKQQLFLSRLEVILELTLLPSVLKLVNIEISLSLHHGPDNAFYLIEIGSVHSFQVLSQPTVSHHFVQSLLQQGFLSKSKFTKQVLPNRWL